MITVTITINDPVLQAGQTFKVRYRKVGGSYGSQTTQTNASFDISVSEGGDYELEVILDDNGFLCPAIIKPFIVKDSFTCIDFTVTMQRNPDSGIYYLQINYTIPPSFVDPPCGWRIEYDEPNIFVTKVVNYTTLPFSGQIIIPVLSNGGSHVAIKANLCDGYYQECFNGDIAAFDGGCTDITINSVTITHTGPGNYWKIDIHFTQGSPITVSTLISYTQTGALIPPSIPDSGTVPYGPGIGVPTGTLSFKVYPSPMYAEIPTYRGTITDSCGNAIPWSV